MNTIIELLLLALLLLAPAGCSYSDPEIYYVEPVADDPASVVVSTNLDSLDTVVVADSLLFKYETGIEGGEMYLVEAWTESLTIHTNYTSYDPDTLSVPFSVSDSFWISQDFLADTGITILQFSVYFSSNTNSLADVAGLEADVIDLEFSLSPEGGKK